MCAKQLCYAVHGGLAVRHAAPGQAEGGLQGLRDEEHLTLDQGVLQLPPLSSDPYCGHSL
jgi:hypothetical protein